MIGQAVPDEQGDYVVESGRDDEGRPIRHRFENVTFAYGMDDALAVQRGGSTIATFRWWDSIMQADATDDG
jgi:hypothetical protein